MGNKRILIVDDEETILTVLKGSLRVLGPEYEVVTATSGDAALERLHQQTFDVVVTDYLMGGMDGLQLMEIIHSINPETRVIMLTAYGGNELEEETRRLQAYRYLSKPLEIHAFRQVVQEALGDLAINRPGILILSDLRFKQLNRVMEQLRVETGASCVFLSEIEGKILVRAGMLDEALENSVVSLLGESMANVLKAGNNLDGEGETINLIYREGKRQDLYALNVAGDLLLVLLVDRKEFGNRLGTVWFYVRKAALEVRKTLGESEQAGVRQFADDGAAKR
jgi:two-component system response regulator (stage 0 sporulation protein F)